MSQAAAAAALSPPIATRSETTAHRQPRRRVVVTPYLYLAPLIAMVLVFTYWPLLHTAYLSLIEWNLRPGAITRFVGADNYQGVLSSTLFEAAAWNTLIYIVVSVPLKVLLPIPIALFLWTLAGGGQAYRTILFLPTLISFVVVSVVAMWLLNPIGGHVPTLLRMVGIVMPSLMTDANSAIWLIIGLSAWKVLGFNVLLYLAGLTRINRDYIEAMRIDGASDGTILTKLVWPLLTPTTLFVLVSTVIFTMQQVFTPIDILTEGGPMNSTTNLFYLVYQYAFRTFNIGYGAAGTVMLFGALLLITVTKLRLLDRRVHYEQ